MALWMWRLRRCGLLLAIAHHLELDEDMPRAFSLAPGIFSSFLHWVMPIANWSYLERACIRVVLTRCGRSAAHGPSLRKAHGITEGKIMMAPLGAAGLTDKFNASAKDPT